MRRLFIVCVLLAWSAPATAQQSVTVTLTARQVEALRVAFGAEVPIAPRVQAWVDDWLVQFVRARDEQEQREIKAALDTAAPAVATQVRTLLKVAEIKAVTAEERAAKDAADKAAAKAERDNVRADVLKALLDACKAQTPPIDCGWLK